MQSNVPKYVFITLILFSFNLARADACKQVEGSILVLGDSLSAAYGLREEQGWVALLGQRWQSKFPKVQLVNASVSGATTAAGLQRLPALLKKHQPEWLVLELGGNDGLQGKPINYIRSNLIKMITLVERAGAEVFLAGMQLPPNLGERYTKPFFNVYQELSEKKAVTAYQPFLLEGVATKAGMMQEDGIHPKAEGQKHIYQLMEPALANWVGRGCIDH